MIHGNSNDPVNIKKIYLKIWRLRDEIEALIKRRLKGHENVEDFDIDQLIKEYKAAPTGTNSEEDAQLNNDSSETTDRNTEDAKNEEEESSNAGPSKASKNEEASYVIQRGPHHLPEDKIYKGMCILSEVYMDHMYFFSDEHFLEGQSVVIEFQVPKKFIVNADVAYCRAYNLKSRIISKDKRPYRTAAKFTFLKEGERTLLRNFVSSVEPVISETPPVNNKASQDSSDEFDDLDNLDL